MIAHHPSLQAGIRPMLSGMAWQLHKAPVPQPVEDPLPDEQPVPQDEPVPSPHPEIPAAGSHAQPDRRQ